LNIPGMRCRGGNIIKMYNIALIPGDGIGPEVIEEGKIIVDFACQSNGIEIKWHEYPFGAEYYLKTGILLPDSALDEIKDMDAIYFGAVGDPAIKPGILEKEILLKIRFFFDQYINLRPVKLYEGVPSPLKNKDSKDIDFYVIRENTEDFYIGTGGRFNSDHYQKKHTLQRKLFQMGIQFDFQLDEPEEFGYQLGILSKKGSERIIKYAFDFAERKNLQKVSTVDKVNVLSDMYQLWRDVFKETAANYPEIETDYYYIDAMTMFFVSQPERFKIIVSPNMFGDIITDLGSTIQGGIGMAAGANINPTGVSMFEPIHGSAPDLKNKFIANPIGTIIAGAMMMEELGENKTALTIENAVVNMLKKGEIQTVDMGGNSSTKAVGDAVMNELAEISNN
jgi:isocitrate/isopropylmalate dehydrogenase